MTIFKLPDLGEGLPDAQIRQWHVSVGDNVAVDQPLVSMETAKAIVEVPAPHSGIIKELHGNPGDTIETGAPLVAFESEQDTGTVAGSIEVGHEVVEETATILTRNRTKTYPGAKATPAIRALATKLGVDLSKVTGTGPNGRITTADVNNYSQQASTSTSWEHAEPLPAVRVAMAEAMTSAAQQVSPATLVEDASLHQWQANQDISYRVIRALVNACQQEPSLNAWFDSQSMSRKLFAEQIHLGLAIDAAEGLFVPVIRDVQNLINEPSELRALIEDYKAKVQDRSIDAKLLREPTITLSNFGTVAGRYANPVVVPPQVAILGTGKIREQVVAYQNEIAIHKIMPLSLTIDHRAVTGGEAARFLAAVINDLEKEN